MKTRNGFVSNSSSASYIVKICDTSYEDFLHCLDLEYDWAYFNKEILLNEINKLIEEQKKRIEEIQKRLYNSDVIKALVFDIDNNFLKKLENDKTELVKIEEDNERALIEYVLKRDGIVANISPDGGIVLNYSTAMHNDFNSGMSDLLKEIVLFFMFDLQKKIECQVEYD